MNAISLLLLWILSVAGMVQENKEVEMLQISSKAFEHNQMIPSKYTCEGEDVSPPLSIDGIPQEAKSVVIIVDDPDAPVGVWDHWIAWNLPPDTKTLAEAEEVPVEGKNDFKELRYRGPCPPPGAPHRYFFKVYALDTLLSLPAGSTKKEVEAAMQGHILSQGELIGLYQR